MNTVEENQKYLSRIVGEQLIAVNFVLDYLYLQFNECFLTVLTPLVVVVGEQSLKLGDLPYRDALCERITHNVTGALLSSDHLRIDFDDGSRFIVSLIDEVHVGSEAILFQFPEAGQMQLLVMHRQA